MFVQTSKWLLVVMLSLTLGFHWALLQSVAWAGMIVQFSGRTSLQQAVAKTFDGQHPCPICKLVQSGKKSEGKSEGRLSLQKFELFADCPAGFYFPPSTESAFVRPPLLAGRVESPRLPPPRTFPG